MRSSLILILMLMHLLCVVRASVRRLADGAQETGRRLARVLIFVCPSVTLLRSTVTPRYGTTDREFFTYVRHPPTEREPRTIIHLSFVSLRGVKYSDVHVALADVALHPRGSSKRSSRRKLVFFFHVDPKDLVSHLQLSQRAPATSDGARRRRPATSDERRERILCSVFTTYNYNYLSA